MMRLDKLERYVETLIGARDFTQLLLPFATVATDLENGEQVVFTTGSVAKAVRASCSVPGLFEPFRDGETALVDGGLVNDVPADAARALGADIVIAVNLHSRKLQSGPPRNILDIAYYTFDILLANAGQRGISQADIVVGPDLRGFHYRNLKKADELVERGAQAMRGSMGELKQIISARRQRTSNA
jgi:NTE family protein